MDYKKMFINMSLSWITLIELIIIWILYKIFPFILFLLLMVFCLGYKAYEIFLLIKRNEAGINAEIDQQTMRGFYYSKNFGKIIEEGDYMIPQLSSNNDVLIKVKCAGINPVDYKIQCGKIPFFRWYCFPYLGIGYDLSGEVIKVGSKVTKFKEGDKVFGFASNGCLQEYSLSKDFKLALIPENLNYEEAAALPIAACTSYQSLVYPLSNQNNYDSFELTGKNVLVIGASGGTGHLGVQIARALGAQEVYGICSNNNLQKVQDMCVCNQVFSYDSETIDEDLENNFKSTYGDPKLDIIYDTVTSSSDGDQGIKYKKYLKSYENGGFYVYINSFSIIGKIKCFLNYISPKLNFEKKGEHVLLLKRKNDKTIEKIRMLAENGKIKPIIQRMYFDYESVIKAFNLLKSRRTVGKIVFEISS